MLGTDYIQATKLARHATRGAWPQPGGLLDQLAWFVRYVEAIQSDVAAIDDKRFKERKA